MSKGNPLKVLILFTLPMILSVSFQQLYNIADSVIAGQFIENGKQALASVSVSYPITMIFMAIGTGLGVGCSVVTSRLYGSKDFTKLKSAVSTAFISFLLIAVVCSVVGFFSARPLLELLNTPSTIIEDASSYLSIYMLGLPFVFLYNSCSATFQSLGNSKIPLYFLIGSTLFNVGLDIVFVTACGWGVWSLSFATVIAQAIACVLSVIVLCYILTNLEGSEGLNFKARVRKTVRSIGAFVFGKKPYRRFTSDVFKEIMHIGIPSVIQSSTVSIGQLMVQNLVNGFGDDVVAGYGAAIKINTFCIAILIAIANAVSIFVSQNIGAKKPERIMKGTKSGFLLIYALAAVLVPIGVFGREVLVSLFVDGKTSAEVIKVGSSMLLVVTPFYLVVVAKFISDSVLKGAGAMAGFISSTSIDLVLRVGCSYLLAHVLDSYVGIWWSWAIGWAVGVLVSLSFFFFGRWRKVLKPINESSVEPENAENL